MCSLETYAIPGAQGVELPEGDGGPFAEWARKGTASGGVLDHGTQEEDDPDTWEALAFLDYFRGPRAGR